LADNCNQYLEKGRQVYCEGILVSDERGNPRIWTDQDGNCRSNFELRAFTVRFLQGGQSDSAAPGSQENSQPSQPPSGPIPIDEDEIPF
jgi:single-stranded DNA-binding protein